MKHFRNKGVLLSLLLCISVSWSQAQIDIPDAPVFKSASVSPGAYPGEVTLRWFPSDSADVKGYIIYQVVGSTSITIDTVYGRLSASYVNLNSQAALQTETYRIAAFDSLLFKSMITDPHTTMLISSEYEECSNKVNLTWTAYLGYTDGVSAYRVFRKSATSAYSSIAVLEGDVLQYTDNNPVSGQAYCYYVEALSSEGYAATSNETCKYLEGFQAPGYLIPKSVIVEGNAVVLEFYVDTLAEVGQYKLLRSNEKEGVYRSISTAGTGLGSIISFTDTDVEVNEQVFFYKLASYDPCGKVSAYSAPCCNIVATTSGTRDLTHFIEWTSAEFISGVDVYSIKGVFGGAAPISVADSDFADLFFTNSISSYVSLRHARKEYVTNSYCYYVEAYENNELIPQPVYGYSKSNLACVKHTPIIYIPTAFAPSSFIEKNKVFRPVISFSEEFTYEMIIFDRWGLEVFSTNDTFEGWNGYVGDKRAPADIYMYRISFKNAGMQDHTETGYFVLRY